VTYQVVLPGALPFPQLSHLIGGQLVQRQQRHTPAVAVGHNLVQPFAGEGGIERLELAARHVLDGVGQDGIATGLLLDPVLKAHAEAALAGDVGAAGRLGGDELLHQALGHDEARAAVGEPAAVGALVRGAKVVGDGGVVLAEQAEQRVPEEVDVRLEEDEPLGLGVGCVGAVDHGQVLEAVELEAALRLVDRLALDVGLVVPDVGLEVDVVGLVALGQVGEDVDDAAVAQLLLAVADDDEVVDAARDGAQVGLVDGRLARGHLEHDLDMAEQVLGEVLAVVELDGIGGARLEGREEGLCLGRVHGMGLAGAAVQQRVGEVKEEHAGNQEPPRPAGAECRHCVESRNRGRNGRYRQRRRRRRRRGTGGVLAAGPLDSGSCHPIHHLQPPATSHQPPTLMAGCVLVVLVV
jgi:hypothetical protein